MNLLRNMLMTMILMAVSVLAVQAQDDEITDEDIKKYALLTEVVDQMKKEVSTVINELIRNQEGMNGQRYLELAKTKGDADKLAAIDAKDYEVKFLELVEGVKNERMESIKTVNQELATKMLGNNGRDYKAVKAAVESDPAVKTKFEAALAEIKGEKKEKA